MSDHILELRDVSQTYHQGNRPLDILKGANLSLQKGKLTALIGPSGAGKTSLLNIAGLLEGPTSGQVLVGGVDMTNSNSAKRAEARRKYIGFVFQYHRLLPEFSALENVIIPQMINGLSYGDASVRATQLLEMVGLKDRLQHRPGLLSGGEQQRAAIVRAIANAPAILLADEPTGNLDPQTAASVFSHLKQIVQLTDTAALIVTHNKTLASEMDEILKLDNGQVHKVVS